MTNHPYTLLGLLIGVACGFAGAFGGFTAFLVVLVVGIAGIIAGRVADGELDLTAYLGGRSRDRSDR